MRERQKEFRVMPAEISDYAMRSAVLLHAAERFADSLSDLRGQEATTRELLSAAELKLRTAKGAIS